MRHIFCYRTVLAVAGFMSLLSSCNNKPTDITNAAAFDVAAARKLVEDGSAILMDRLKKGDSIGFSNMFTIDAKVLPSGMPAVSGRDAIQSLFGFFIRTGINDLTLTTIDVWGNGSFIVEEGSWKVADTSGKEMDHGKYLKLWKMEDGNWKLFRECFNSDIPPATAK